MIEYKLEKFFDVVIIWLVLEAELAAIFEIGAKFRRKAFTKQFEWSGAFLY